MAAMASVGSPSIDRLVARIDPWTSCWGAEGTTREIYKRDLKGFICRILDNHFESLPGRELLTLSLYMIGRRETSARPTVLIISSDVKIRKAAQKAIKESKILQQYPQFQTKCMNKDPGTLKLLPLAFGALDEPSPELLQNNLQVLYDISRPMIQTGLPIYIRHSLSLRPATANAIHVGTRLYLQTVAHAFHDTEIITDIIATASTEDLVIDSDSDSDTDYNNEMHIGITSAASQSLETFSFADRNESEHSHSPSIVSNCSTPVTSAGQSSQGCALSTNMLTQALEEATPSRSLVPVPRNFAVRQPIQPSEASLRSLGCVIKISEANDWALIEITAAEVEEQLRLCLKDKDAPSLAYEKVAAQPPDFATVYTYTASGQKISGVLSDTCSCTRLPNGTHFRDIYVARLDSALSNGDCGAVLFDAQTHETYGHLVAGCKRTGTAYILAAQQTATDLIRFREILTDSSKSTRLSSDTPNSLSPVIELQHNEADSETHKSPPVVDRAASLFPQEPQKPAVPWRLLLPFAKTWSEDFSNDRVPSDTPYVDELRVFFPALDGVLLFLDSYGGDTMSFDLEAVVQFCQESLVSSIREQSKLGSAWLDDRTYPAYNRQSTFPSSAAPHLSVDATSEAPSVNRRVSTALYPEYTNRSLESIIPAGVANALNASPRPTSTRYIPSSRRYPAPLTAELLFENLKKKRYNHPDLPDSDRRLVFIANPDGYDILAVTETAPEHLREAVGEFLEKYVSLRTALKVKISDRGYPSYQIQCHLPHFVLREKRQSPKRHTESLQRARIDLSFLAQALPPVFNEAPLELIQAQISVVLCGTSETRYTVYGFEDNDHDADREMGDDEFSEEGFQADQIANGEIDANLPIWNPREYFLVTMLKRITQVAGEWARIVHVIESASDRFASGRTDFASRSRNPFFCESIATTSFWTRGMLQVLRQLLRTIRETNKAWETFIFDNGDIGYFSDLISAQNASTTRIQRTLHQIQAAFDDLKGLHDKISDIQEECEKFERALEVRLMVEANKNTELTILYICPVVVVSTFFAIPNHFISLPRNIWSFTSGVILVSVVLYFLRSLLSGRLRQQRWWHRLATRASIAKQGDRTNTTENAAGMRAVRRRATHQSVVER